MFKKNFNDLKPMYLMSISLSFMLFIYEMIMLYASDVNSFWFNFKDMFLLNILFFVIFFLIMSIICTLIYYVFKNKNLYKYFSIIYYSLFIYSYIIGNYFAGFLPKLDGTEILWSNYTKISVISCTLLFIIIGICIYVFKKYKFDIFKKVISYSSLIVIVMLSVSLIPILFNKDLYIKKGNYVSTYNNLNKISTNNNMIMLVIDSVDSKLFYNTIKDYNKEDVFNDFTYFPDTLAAYPFTRESIPLILTGKWYEATESFSSFYKDSFNNSNFINTLNNNNYEINIYDMELSLDSNDVVKNYDLVKSNINFNSFIKQEIKYILFKYLAFPLKRLSKIESLNFDNCRVEENIEIFNWDDKLNYDKLDDLSLINDNYFQFLHIEGSHAPFDLNENMEEVDGTEIDKELATITFISKYLDRIKNSGQYDNSIIIIMADHGCNDYAYDGRQNPVFFVKGINEHHELLINDTKVSYDDLNTSIYTDLLDGKSSSSIIFDSNRTRRFIWYKDYDNMIEQSLSGHAWETDKLIDTGKKYVR